MANEPVGEMDVGQKVDSKFIMPFGKHKGKYLGDIPARYLLWLADDAENPPVFAIIYVNSKRAQLEDERDDEMHDSECDAVDGDQY